MERLLAPAIGLAKRIGPAWSWVAAAALLAAAQLLACVAGGEPSLTAGAAALWALALYGLAGMLRATTGAMEKATSEVERVASGDLSTAAGAPEEHGTNGSGLARTLAVMKRNLVEIVRQARSSAENIRAGANEIAAGNLRLSERTEAQAAALQQTSASTEQLAASALQSAGNCAAARTAADDVARVTQQGARAMQELAATMTRIEEGSRRITEITGVIEGIAFQTNILALNAAVEAARAGEQGRGFAVVASEVRALAERSAVAAKEIKELIGTSVASVDDGARLVRGAGGTMEEALAGARNVSALIGDIANASAHQTAGVDSVRQAVAQIDHATQENAALAQRARAAAQAFEEEAERLVNAVGAFKVDRVRDRETAIALVKRAIEHLRHRGAEQARRDFEDPRGGFMEREFYVFGNRVDGTQLFNAKSPATTGKNTITKKDAHGHEFVRAYIELARTHGYGWHDYHHWNPLTGRVAAKSAYVELVGDMVVGCGIYKDEVPGATARGVPALTAPAR